MLNIEYVRSLNSNYERIRLDKIPEEKRYQYCILGRCQIKGLLSCSLRYINGVAYLYYDISSRQNISYLYENHCITREWMKDFIWSLKQMRQELGRFLLDMGNILWYPDQIYQDLESNVFSFLYLPYYEGESSFMKLMEFWVEHIDYNDEALVDCVYRMYERLERNGEVYLQNQIFDDAESLKDAKIPEVVCTVVEEKIVDEPENNISKDAILRESRKEEIRLPDVTVKSDRKGIRGILEGKRSRNKKIREDYRQNMQQAMVGYAVAEEKQYEGKKYGQTIYIEEMAQTGERTHRLLSVEGKLLVNLESDSLSIGKKKEGIGLVLNDSSVSRIHARITKREGYFWLEDLNSTNGTFHNGLRMQPYEKKRLDEGDEIRCGKSVVIFR